MYSAGALGAPALSTAVAAALTIADCSANQVLSVFTWSTASSGRASASALLNFSFIESARVWMASLLLRAALEDDRVVRDLAGFRVHLQRDRFVAALALAARGAHFVRGAAHVQRVLRN